MSLTIFNGEAAEDAVHRLRPCLDIDRWIDAVVRGRPYPDLPAVESTARSAAEPFTDAEIDQALGHHPPIGDQADGDGSSATLSRGEQSGLSLDDEVQARLRHQNRTYQDRFGHVFLIRAAGRSSAEILSELERRLGNSAADEREETAQQLREIAVLRLQEVI